MSAASRSPALAEQGVARAVLAGEARHVLDDAGDSQVALARHVGRPPGHLLRGERRRGHDEQLGPREHAGEAHLHVARPGRHVDQQVVERSPGDVFEEVLDRPVRGRGRAT